MAATAEVIKRRLGLDSAGNRKAGSGVLLTGAASNPDSGLVAALSSHTRFDVNDNPVDLHIDYLRHLPYGTSQKQSLIRMSFSPTSGASGMAGLSQIWVQSLCVFDRARGDDPSDPAMQKKINRVMGAVNGLNTLLREQGPVENAAKILLTDMHLEEVTGESIVLRGLDRKGGFETLYLPGLFMKAAGPDSRTDAAKIPPLEFRNIDANDLKTLLGFPINTLEPDKNHAGSRQVSATDPDSGVGFLSGVRLKETARKLEMEIYVEPEDVPAGLDPKSIPNLLKFSFSKKGKDAYVLDEAFFLGQKIEPSDTKIILGMIGLAQASNRELAKRKYPAFIDSTAQFDLLDLVNPLSPPPALKDGGEMLHVSLHGSGTEKRIENFGDQIGIAALFLQRGTKEDGSVSTVGVAVDFPFAAGGPDSGYDGAVPDYLPFLKDIKAFFITHDHFDHDGGLSYYVRKGLMRDKTVYAEERVIYMIQQGLQEIPRRYWPHFEAVRKEGATPILDDEGNTRFWVQHCANATRHSALCTPYIVTGCVNDMHYNGSAMVYGDSRGIVEGKQSFFEEGTRVLPAQAAARGKKITAEKLPEYTSFGLEGDKKKTITLALNDTTAVREEGISPGPEQIKSNWDKLFATLKGKGILMAPISTNHMEYSAGIEIAAIGEVPRNITAVGRNAELRLATLNMFGVDPELDLAALRLDPLEESFKGISGKIPQNVLDAYNDFLESKKLLCKKLGLDSSTEQEWDEARRIKFENALKREVGGDARLFARDLDLDQKRKFRSTHAYMLQSLMEKDAVIFSNDINGFMMWKAIEAGKEWVGKHATRGSQTAREFRRDSGSHLIFTTSTQNNAEERFSTLQKFIDSFSLLDVDEKVRNTGYKIDPKNYAIVIPQSPIPGNDASQRRMIEELVRARDVMVIAAFKDGFTIYNPKEMRADILSALKEDGRKWEVDAGGNIGVYSMPIHLNGHGRRNDVKKIVQAIKAEVHAAHHIPDADAIVHFNDLLDKNGITRAQEKPDDFKVSRIDGHKKTAQGKFKTVAHLNPSYILVRMVRKYGQFFGGFLEWSRMTLLKREGMGRADGLHAGSATDGAYTQKTARIAWDHVSNPHSPERKRRVRKLEPAADSVTPAASPRSRPLFGAYKPPGKAA
jgi:hypothetical protein